MLIRFMSIIALYRAYLLQSYVISRKEPHLHNKMIKISFDNAKLTLSNEEIARISCSIDCIRIALEQSIVKLCPRKIFSISFVFVALVQDSLSTPTDEILHVGIKISKALDIVIEPINAEWVISFNLLVSSLIANKQNGSTITVASFEMIHKASKYVQMFHCSPWQYMKFVCSVASRFDTLQLLEQTPIYYILKCIYYEKCRDVDATDLIHDIGSFVDKEYGLNPINLLLDTAKVMLGNDKYIEAKQIFEAIALYKKEYFCPELDLICKFLKYVFWVTSNSTGVNQAHSFEIMAKIVRDMSAKEMDTDVHECSIIFWNHLVPQFENVELKEQMIRNMEIIYSCLENVSQNDVSYTKNLFQLEILRYRYESSPFLTSISDESQTDEDIATFKSVRDRLLTAATFNIEKVVPIYIETLKLILPLYTVQNFETRIEYGVPNSPSLSFTKAMLLLEVLQSLQNKFFSKVLKRIDIERDLWDLAFVATEHIIRFQEDKQTQFKIEETKMFQVHTIKLNCIFDGFMGHLSSGAPQYLNELTIKALLDAFNNSIKVGRKWMILNSLCYFWRYYCLSNSTIQTDIWIDAISHIYQVMTTERILGDQNYKILIHCMYATCQLDKILITQQNTSQTTKGTNNIKELTVSHLKNAEEALKLCSELPGVRADFALFLFPIWHRLQQVKSQSNTNYIAIGLDSEDDLVKLLSSFEFSTFNKTDSVKYPIAFENFEHCYSLLQTITKLPTLLRIKMYQNLVNLAAQGNQVYILVGLLKKLLHIAHVFQKNVFEKNTPKSVPLWCSLVQIETLKVYSEVSGGNYDVLLFANSLSEDLIPLLSTNPLLLSKLLAVIWNFSCLYFDSHIGKCAYDLMFSVISRVTTNINLKDIARLGKGDPCALLETFTCIKDALKVTDTGTKIRRNQVESICIQGKTFEEWFDSLSREKGTEKKISILHRYLNTLQDQNWPKEKILNLYYCCCLYGIETEFEFIESGILESNEKDYLANLDWLSILVGVLSNLQRYTTTKNETFKHLAGNRAQSFVEKIIDIWNILAKEDSTNRTKSPTKGKKDQAIRPTYSSIILNIATIETFQWPHDLLTILDSHPVFSELVNVLKIDPEMCLQKLQEFIEMESNSSSKIHFFVMIIADLLCVFSLSKNPLYFCHQVLQHSLVLQKLGNWQNALVRYNQYLEKIPLLIDSIRNISTDFEANLAVRICQHAMYFEDHMNVFNLLKQLISSQITLTANYQDYCFCTLASLLIMYGEFASGKRILEEMVVFILLILSPKPWFMTLLYL
jgi:hypothetical protein